MKATRGKRTGASISSPLKLTTTPESFADRWRRVGPILARIRRQELRQLKARGLGPIIDSLFELGADHGLRRTSSGLVEWYKLLSKRAS